MKNNQFDFLLLLPKWRIIRMLVLSIGLTALTISLMYRIVLSFIDSSITLSGLLDAFISLVGAGKFYQLTESLGVTLLYYLFLFSVFLFYLYLFYRYEKRKYEERCLQQLVTEIGFIADGHFDHQVCITTYGNEHTKQLAKDINRLVAQLKLAVEEERRSEQAKNDLITNVSHDLRTPLTSIIGYLGLIDQDRYKDELELRYYIQIAYQKVTRLNTLINDLFEYTRVQNTGLAITKIPINMAEMLGQLIVQFRLQLQEAQMECRSDVSMDKLMVLGDSNKLARVFENLLQNAIRYGKNGGYVDVSAREEDEHIVIDVTNYGEPIPSIDLPHIFERFYRIEKSRSEYTGGTGLGLAIAKGIIDLHEGSITAYSDSEKTIFTVKLKSLNGSAPS